MKNLRWWSPEAPEDTGGQPATLLSRRWVQTFLFELPALKRAELESSLRYKVRSTLPIDIENFVMHTQIVRRAGKIFGAVFLSSDQAKDLLAGSARALRVGVPLFIAKNLGPRVLLLIASSEGLEVQFYENGALKTSHAPIAARDTALRERISAQYPDARIVGLAPDPAFPLPPDLSGGEIPAAARARLLDSFPAWATKRSSMLPQIAASVLMVAGIALCAMTLTNQALSRQKRNAEWKAWVAKAESAAAAPSARDQTAAWLKAEGIPVPELFVRLAKVWGSETQILDLEWLQGKLVLTARSPSALASLKKLIADPWFHDLRVDDIQLQKDGHEVFTVDGSLAIDK